MQLPQITINIEERIDMEDVTLVDHTDDAYEDEEKDLKYEGYLNRVRKKLEDKRDVTKLDDVIAKVDEEVPEDHCIGSLNLVGHAGEGTFNVGSGRDGGDPETTIDVQKDGWKEKLGPLKGRFCPGTGRVRLLGCGTSEGEGSRNLLQEMANLLGVPVGGNMRKSCNVSMFDNTGWTEKADHNYIEWAIPGGDRFYTTSKLADVWPPAPPRPRR